jgi:hypothetical protein
MIKKKENNAGASTALLQDLQGDIDARHKILTDMNADHADLLTHLP